jgi:hypothetical protein
LGGGAFFLGLGGRRRARRTENENENEKPLSFHRSSDLLVVSCKAVPMAYAIDIPGV